MCRVQNAWQTNSLCKWHLCRSDAVVAVWGAGLMMKIAVTVAGTVAGLLCAGIAGVQAAEPTPEIILPFARQAALVDEYCMECHNYNDNAGGLALLLFDPANVEQDAEITEGMIRKMRAGMMPPAGAPRPDFETVQAMAASLEVAMDATPHYSPGWHGLHRLNRAEYANVVGALLDLDVDAAKLLPTDDASNGFDNQAGTLGLSPVLLEAYLSSAGKLARLAVGNITAPVQETFRVAQDTTQNYHVEGLPFGTRGGTLVQHTFPADGDYTVKVFAVNLGNMGNFRPFGEMRGEQLEILVDGARVGLFDWDEAFRVGQFGGGALRTIDVTVPVTAGPHAVGVTFLASNYAPGLDLNNAFERSTIETGGLPGFTFYPHVGSVRIDGPYQSTGVADSPSRRRLFVCTPQNTADEVPCAEDIVRTLAHRAYRGFEVEDDIATLMHFYDLGRQTGGFDSGIEAAVQRVLSDPKFIYRVETAPQELVRGGIYRVSDLELASRLSFFIWSSMPDDELLALAADGQLGDPAILERQVMRMLDDPRSMALTANFAGQWLALRNLDGHQPVVTAFPDFDDNLRQAFRRETELFFDSLIRENRSIMELLTADYTTARMSD